MYGNVLRCRRSWRAPWVVWTIAALVAAWHLLTQAAPVADPDWCSGQGRSRHQHTASAALLQLAFEEANRGRNEAALSALCAAFVREDVQRQDQVAGNIANYAGTILFRGPGNLDLAISAFRDSIALSDAGKVYSDESVQALSGAFLQAGADAVISSLWLVDDASTSLLMSDFYEAFARGVPTSLALKGAIQRAMKRNPHPFYWAAFTYMGPP